MKKSNMHQFPEDVRKFVEQHPDVVEIMVDFMDRQPELESVINSLMLTYMAITECFKNGGKLFLCGNGGSYADSLHISGEMIKSYERNRNLSAEDKKLFAELLYGDQLAEALEYGFPVIVLGLNPSFKTAVENDIWLPNVAFAQELFALGRKEDLLLALSTSGNAQNVLYAVSTAKAIGMQTIGLTGQFGGELVRQADLAIQAPELATKRIQENHQQIYHTLCSMVEAHYFQVKR